MADFGVGQRDVGLATASARERDRDLDGGQRLATVALRHRDEVGERVVVDRRALGFEAALHELGGGRFVERLEPEQRGPRHQRRVDLEVRVLGRRADEDDQAALDGRQQRVLLRLVEAVDLVEEQDRALVVLAEPALGPLEHLADVLHACAHRRQLLELLRRRARR